MVPKPKFSFCHFTLYTTLLVKSNYNHFIISKKEICFVALWPFVSLEFMSRKFQTILWRLTRMIKETGFLILLLFLKIFFKKPFIIYTEKIADGSQPLQIRSSICLYDRKQRSKVLKEASKICCSSCSCSCSWRINMGKKCSKCNGTKNVL